MLGRIIFILLITAVSVFPGPACSSEEKRCQTEEEWNPLSAGPVITWTAPVCGKGEFIVQPFLLYNRTFGAFDAEGHYEPLPKGDKEYQYQEQLFAQYGITNKFEVDALITYQENYIRQDNSKASADGFGDSYLFLRYCAFEEKGWRPHITCLTQLKIPTGKYQHVDLDNLGVDLMGAASGGGSWDGGVGINLSKRLKPFIFHADAVYSFPRQVRIEGAKTSYGNYFNYDFAVECFLPGGFNLLFEANEFVQGDMKQNDAKIPATGSDSFTLGFGAGWSNDKIQTLLAYLRTAAGTNTDAYDSVILTCVYAF